MERTFERGDEIGREVCTLPAASYNRLMVLFGRDSREPLFIAIRSMQYLVIIDHGEVVIVDGVGRRFIAISWQDFRRDRDDLQASVGYDRVFYQRVAIQINKCLQIEFFKAVVELEHEQTEAASHDASVPPTGCQGSST